MTTSIASFRAQTLDAHAPPFYRGWLHLGWTSATSLGVIALAASQLGEVALAAWLTVPLTVVFANLVEYSLHRWPMHRRWSPMGLLYDRHTLSHHKAFHHDSMALASEREFLLVLFPPWAVLGLSGIVAPVALALGALLGPDVAWLFVGSGLAYFVFYEWLHLAYHLDPEGPIGRLPGMAFLRHHHTVHHDLTKMGRYNFNVHFPLGDWLFGTIWQADPPDPV